MEEKHKCPICGQYEFDFENCMDSCDVCNWSDDSLQVENPDYKGGANHMSFNEAKEAYKRGEHIH